MIIAWCHLLIWKYDWFLYFASFAKKCKTHDGTCKFVENFYMHISRFFFSRGKGGVIIWLSRGWVWHLFVCNFTILNILWSTYDSRFPDAITHKYNKKCYQKTKLIMLIWLHLQSRTGNIKMTFLIILSFFTKVMYIGCLSACSLTHTGLMTIIYTLHRFYHWRYYMHILSNDLPYQ